MRRVVRHPICHPVHIKAQKFLHSGLGRRAKTCKVELGLSTGYGEDGGVESFVAINLRRTEGVVTSVHSIVDELEE